jgi:hypothetical protein
MHAGSLNKRAVSQKINNLLFFPQHQQHLSKIYLACPISNTNASVIISCKPCPVSLMISTWLHTEGKGTIQRNKQGAGMTI